MKPNFRLHKQPISRLRKMFLWLPIVWAFGLLAACTPESTAPTTVAPIAQATLSLPTPSATAVPPSETPQPALTPFSVPTRTPSATFTVTPQQQITAVPTIVETKPTPEFLATSVSQSPDGQWTAESSLAYISEEGLVRGYDTRLQVSRADGSVTWTLVDYEQDAGLGYAIPVIHRWSADGEHVYFTNSVVPDGCGLFVNGSDLHRADLSTGEATELMPALARALSLSPDETTVAYFPWGPMPDLVLRDLAEGTERKLAWEIPFNDAGNIVWSPDGSALALILSADSCRPNWNYTTVKVDVPTLEPTVLLENDDRLLSIVSWPEPNRLLLRDWDDRSWSLDTDTGEVTPVE